MTPLTPAVFHILLALAGGRRHGYGISKDVLRQTDGQVRMGPGTLYGTLQRLLDLGWVEAVEGPGKAGKPDRADKSDRTEKVDERRRYYRLKALGRRSLEAEVKRMESLVRTARAERVIPRSSRS